MALGFSHCLKCSNGHQALWIVFVAAGFVLVLGISFLNLTVTQGKVNGVIFYASIL